MLILLIICFLIFLYNIYFVSHDDFVINRKDIQIQKIFNIAFLTSFVALFFSRLLFVIFNPSVLYFNILSFIAFPYLPGLSLIGGLTSGLIFLGFYTRKNKLPIGKFLDLFTVSFIAVLPIAFLLFFLISLGKTEIIFNTLFIASFFIALIFIKIVYKLAQKGDIKDGSFTMIFLSIFSLIYFLIKLFVNLKSFSFLNLENIFLFFVIFASLILLVNHEIMNKILENK